MLYLLSELTEKELKTLETFDGTVFQPIFEKLADIANEKHLHDLVNLREASSELRLQKVDEISCILAMWQNLRNIKGSVVATQKMQARNKELREKKQKV